MSLAGLPNFPNEHVGDVRVAMFEHAMKTFLMKKRGEHRDCFLESVAVAGNLKLLKASTP